MALEKEFQLAYVGGLGDLDSIQRMPVGERDWHYTRLAEAKKKEKEEHEKKIREMEQKRSASGSRVRTVPFRATPSRGFARRRR